jgi:tRNA-dihydrouridine synthase B
MGIQIGPVPVEEPVFLAPMSAITDMPFRRAVKRCGAGLVISEMIASQAMIREARDAFLRASHSPDERPVAVQLAGCEPGEMAEAARLCEDKGAAIIDINFGCPAKKVVNGYAGSALMRDEIKAARILEATVKAVKVPVTLKMRLGWDDKTRNAGALARIAESIGIKMISVHGRTRSQFFTGKADWNAVRPVKESTSLSVAVNGDIETLDDAKQALTDSGADAVMIGRGVQGRPWFLNQVAHFLKTGERLPDPPASERLDIALEHYDAMLSHYGTGIGLRCARKHLGWYSKGLPGAAEFRAAVNRMEDPSQVRAALRTLFTPAVERQAA